MNDYYNAMDRLLIFVCNFAFHLLYSLNVNSLTSVELTLADYPFK